MLKDLPQPNAENIIRKFAQNNPELIPLLTQDFSALQRTYHLINQLSGSNLPVTSEQLLDIFTYGHANDQPEAHEQFFRAMLVNAAPDSQSLGQFAQSLGITLPEEP